MVRSARNESGSRSGRRSSGRRSTTCIASSWSSDVFRRLPRRTARTRVRCWRALVAPSPSAILIWGAGGHGKVVADLVRASGHRLAGFIDDDPTKFGCEVEAGGARVVLRETELLDGVRTSGGFPDGVDAVVLAIGDNAARERCLAALANGAVPFLVHPSAVVSPSVTIGRGTVVFPRAVINASASIGTAVILNSAAIIEHDCVVSDGAHISPGAILAG